MRYLLTAIWSAIVSLGLIAAAAVFAARENWLLVGFLALIVAVEARAVASDWREWRRIRRGL